MGLKDGSRVIKYVPSKYILNNGNLFKYKVVIPKAYGTGLIDNGNAYVCGKPQLLNLKCGYTQSFIGLAGFDEKYIAENSMKYIHSKFVRFCLGILKVTQDNSIEKWKYVPLQDFTSNSDIDWTKSVHEIDLQLYRKYGLDEKEIAFIEEKVKAME